MKISELKRMIETAEQLDVRDVDLVINDSRDGETHFAVAEAKFVKAGSIQDPSFVLAVTYKN